MPTRAEHLDDMRQRLHGQIADVGQRVYRSRIKTLAPGQLPAICLYAPEEDSGEFLVQGGAAQYRFRHTLAIEVRVPEADGFDVAAGAIVDQIKALLLTDPEWSGRFKPHPTWQVRQYLERRGEQSFCGEVLTFRVEDKRPTVYPPAAPALESIAVQADVDGDGAPDLTTAEHPPEE